MWLFYNGIDIDYDENNFTEDESIDFARKIIPLAKNNYVDIYDLVLGYEDYLCYINIRKKGAKDEWDPETINFERDLTNNGFDVTFANEDYGDDFDVLIIWLED